MSKYKVEWFRCRGIGWCDLYKVNIESKVLYDIEAVYICWTGTVASSERRYLCVGQGMIVNEIKKLRKDMGVKAFQHQGVFITWSVVPHYRLTAIESYLYRELQPIVNLNEEPRARPKAVNLPFENENEFKDGKLTDEFMEQAHKNE